MAMVVGKLSKPCEHQLEIRGWLLKMRSNVQLRPSLSLPFQGTLRKAKIRVVFTPLPKIGQLMRSVKDDLGLVVSGVCHIPCVCGSCYIEMTGCTVSERFKEYLWFVHLDYSERLAIASHSLNLGHWILFSASEALLESSS